MNQLIVSKKTGFKNTSLSTPIIIRDFRGKIFYSSEGLRLVEQFNLPEGQYLIDSGVFEQMKKPVIYKVPPLPPAERNFPLPENFLIEFAPNINKCTIMWDKKKIVFDNALKNLSLPELYFILYHEFGHSKYKTEKYADLFSVCRMLKMGYNPSQIGASPVTSLSNAQYDRKKFIIKKVIKYGRHNIQR